MEIGDGFGATAARRRATVRLKSYGVWNGDCGGRYGCFWIISLCSGGLFRIVTGGGGDDGEVDVGEGEFLSDN